MSGTTKLLEKTTKYLKILRTKQCAERRYFWVKNGSLSCLLFSIYLFSDLCRYEATKLVISRRELQHNWRVLFSVFHIELSGNQPKCISTIRLHKSDQIIWTWTSSLGSTRPTVSILKITSITMSTFWVAPSNIWHHRHPLCPGGSQVKKNRQL